MFPPPYPDPLEELLMPRVGPRRQLAERNIAAMEGRIPQLSVEDILELGRSRAPASGLDSNGQRTRLIPGPAAEGSPELEGRMDQLVANYFGRNPEGKQYGDSFRTFQEEDGGLGFEHFGIRSGSPDPRRLNSQVATATTMNRQDDRQARGKAFNERRVASLGQKREAMAQQPQNPNMLLAQLSQIVGPEEATRIAIAQMQQDGLGKQRQFESEMELKEQGTRDASHAKSLQMGLANALIQSGDPKLIKQGLAMAQAAGGGEGLASIPGTPIAPSLEDVSGRVQAERALRGTDPSAPVNPNEMLDQFPTETAKAMTREDLLERGLTEQALREMVAKLEEEAQRETWLGRTLSGPSSSLPFGIGQRSEEEVATAARRLQTANAMLNAFLAGR